MREKSKSPYFHLFLARKTAINAILFEEFEISSGVVRAIIELLVSVEANVGACVGANVAVGATGRSPVLF